MAAPWLVWSFVRAALQMGVLENLVEVWFSCVPVWPITATVGFAPTPNGVGFAEGGLVAALVANGATVELSVGALVLYRLITGVFPIAVGSMAYVCWLRGQ
jgi:uncharacterized membrane protein YbhN (UPF0104 family)